MRLFKRDRMPAETPVPAGEPVSMEEFARLWSKGADFVGLLHSDARAKEMGSFSRDDPRFHEWWMDTARIVIELKNHLAVVQAIRPTEPELFEVHTTSLAVGLSVLRYFDTGFSLMTARDGKASDDWWNEIVYSKRADEYARFVGVAQEDARAAVARLKKQHPAVCSQFTRCLDRVEVAERMDKLVGS